ncbi:hypothetical protein A2367_01610 [Candidatus Shapirobacteria bacterium RIFOXYB1_FULL_38_38]|uniref:Uncharacterized protein n=1 Tax=Candidatus Shapirobacteria bacterium RIFOXYB1_FULL_38_38 TaxID=1802151 RepID=A0A1F7SUA4_9BACT|nr:MAG: hypothetical protein A2367_01610 [Candidatus Shapirobacteria bacterium RIFOXYB1_FULL_38_38]
MKAKKIKKTEDISSPSKLTKIRYNRKFRLGLILVLMIIVAVLLTFWEVIFKMPNIFSNYFFVTIII